MEDKLNVEKRGLSYTSYLADKSEFLNGLTDDEICELFNVLNICYECYPEAYDNEQ